MRIDTQQTTDKDVMNFFPPVKLLQAGKEEFIDAKSLRKSPLAEKIFDIGGIKSIFITDELICVTKLPQYDWNDLKPQILAEILDHISLGEETLVDWSDKVDETDVVAKIKGLLDARIRPAVKQDGGDIVFRHFEEGVVYVEMQGNCAGCPYALVTLKDGVEKTLKTYIPEVKEVKSVSQKKEGEKS